MTSATKGAQWISSNISLTGFTKPNAAFMSCKELLENSLDACKGLANISISLRIVSKDNFLEVTCSDNGMGFSSDSVNALHTWFESNRVASGGGTEGTGKFGIGLKAIVMMSHTECGGRDVEIRTLRDRTNLLEGLVIFRLGCNDGQQGEAGVVIKSVEICSSEEVEKRLPSIPSVSAMVNKTTSITAYVPMPLDYTEFLQQLKDYMQGLVFGGIEDLEIALLVDDEEGCDEYCSIGTIPKSVKHQDPSMLIRCVVGLVKDGTTGGPAMRIPRPAIGGTTAVPGRSIAQSPAGQVSIYRYVNGVPLITLGSIETCAILAAVGGVMTKLSPSLGIELENAWTGGIVFRPSSSQNNGVAIKSSSIVSSSIDILSRPSGSTWSRLDIRVFLDLPSSDVDYAGLNKGAVVGIRSATVGGSVQQIVSRCVRNGLKKLQAKYSSQFQSVEEFERINAVNKYIPLVAVNLASLVERARSVDVRANFDQLTAMGKILTRESMREMLLKSLGQRGKVRSGPSGGSPSEDDNELTVS